METIINEFLKSLSLVDMAGLGAVLGLAIYGFTGTGDDDGFGSAGDGGGDGGD
jgi:hypothetical protein